MNVRTAKKPSQRVDTSYVMRFNMQSYGEDNLYPQNIRLITQQSGTAELCLSRYAKFIEGYGFNDSTLAAIILNHRETADGVLHKVSADIARYGGFALHVNYNVRLRVSSISFLPFEQCRLEEEDEDGNVNHILVHPDWRGKKTKSGKRIYVDEKNIVKFPLFDPSPDVVAHQIIEAGGIDAYKGQVLWVSMSGGMTYPIPIYDSVVTDISTDEGLGNIKYRNVRNNFLVNCMLVTRKGQTRYNDDGEAYTESMITPEDLVTFQGDEKSGKIMLVELENNEDTPSVIPFPTKSYDKDFSSTDTSVIERIYAQFHQELFYSIRMGKLGFSGQVMRDAYEYYSGEVTIEQRVIERAFGMLMRNWWDESKVGLPILIQPLKYITTENNTINSINNE